MFSRRKRSSSHHHQTLSTPAAHSAQSAASHAFLKSQPSSNSLSSAAAAAALRNLTPTPTNVENVQTKRMVQRRASTQSPASPIHGRRSASVGGGTLRRSNSSSSMTARTFRDSSPSRPSTSSGASVPQALPVDVPPLPSLPSQYAPRKLPPRRAASLDPSLRSPPASPPRTNARVSSVDRESASGSPSHTRLHSLTTVPELDRPSSRNSVNFSYPRGSRPNSPTLPENQPISLGGTAVRDVSSVEVASAQQAISKMSEKSINTRSKTPAVGRAEASPANKSAGLAAGTAIAAAQAVSAQKSSPQPEPDHARATRTDPGPSATSPQRPKVEHSRPKATHSSEIEHSSSRTIPNQWSSVVPGHESQIQDGIDISRTRDASNQMASASVPIDHHEPITTPQRTPQVTPHASPKAEKQATPQQEAHLEQSSSPGRSARFAKWLSVTATGEQVHEPPSRSLSPGKSALKTTRGNSLSPERAAAGRVGLANSELSDGGTSIASDDGHRVGVKKRAIKVSFDDEAEVVGVAASPPTSPEEYVPDSPPSKSKTRKNWFNVVKKKSPAAEFITNDDDFDEVMKPRAALPSFGSVRGNRNGGPARPPIPNFSDNESTSSSEDEATAPCNSFSNDHALAGILRHEQQEPSQPHDIKSVEQLSIIGSAPSQQDAAPADRLDGVAIGGLTEQQPHPSTDSQLPLPSIAVEPATPPVDERKSFDVQRSSRSSLEQYQIPGGFPPSNSDRSLKSAAETQTTKNQPVASAVPILDEANKDYSDSIYTESDHDSIYSDAPEDPEDGDGFGSINAIVDSRSIPRSAPLEPIAESRDTTPRPTERTAVVENEPQNAIDPSEIDRFATPLEELVSRQSDEASPPESPMNLQTPYPPLSINTQARPSNGSVQMENKQRRPVSVDAYGGSLNSQGPRYSGHTNGAGNGKPRPLSLGPAFQVRGPGLRRTMSSGSDSSSSFKRANSSSRSDGSHAMRRTMRGSAANGQPSSPSARTESPIDHRPLSSGSTSATTMKKTLRGPGAGGEKYSFFSTNKKAPRARFTKPIPKGMQGTRFADSDDERGQDEPQVFRSRFADSSDEGEEPNNAMRPVRGIPRRRGTNDGDSTELEDSSEGERHQHAPQAGTSLLRPIPPRSRDQNVASPNMSGMAAVARQRGMTQRELEEFIMQPPQSRKSSILARLGLKKGKNTNNRISKVDAESPSRRDTPLERSRLERDQLREEPYTNGVQTGNQTTVTATHSEPPSSPKLMKRLTKRNTIGGGQQWPLRPEAQPQTYTPEPVVEPSHSLPSSPLRTQKTEPVVEPAGRNGSITVNGSNAPGTTSILKEPEAPAVTAGPDMNDTASDITSTTNPEDQGATVRDVVIAGPGRKKRFPMLRKAFGLRK
ncbi:hypothetical protein N7481_013052 [Penicillium waksmanii]|uniref:uncharacterized protein n=1 Tax=Penicillium waksmanii TaxID=69791 RepID=UPI002547B372|nr:uncharacterized protein N7481_013052 [Penicillium waksmanii]KAJ5966338.1 hypothetical protein N7481_013052 [Penicillium waksmanii]